MTKRIMVQGTMSSAGKSFVTAGLCRVFRQDGYSVAPFKSQNMALNSFITKDGLEMGRAQVVQAEAAGITPSVLMNPILLKPCSDTGSQVIVKGEVMGTMDAVTYYNERPKLKNTILEAYRTLAGAHQVIVIEGAGSPAEINLMQNDLVNMGMAEMADAPVILVADIDLGGVFAQIYGTIMLLEQSQRQRIKGIVINKFRGDVEILRPGLERIAALTATPVLGVLPYLPVELDEEDRIEQHPQGFGRPLDIAVIRFPRISNTTDFSPLARLCSVNLRYVNRAKDFGMPDMVILPGTKSTMCDLKWMKQNGLAAKVLETAAKEIPVMGICGGYQMLGRTLSDPEHTESGGVLDGLGLLPVDTVFCPKKTRFQSRGAVDSITGVFAPMAGSVIDGYQIHMGKTVRDQDAPAFVTLSDGAQDGCVSGNICGTYLHGLFDGELVEKTAKMLAMRKGITLDESAAAIGDARQFRETQYDLLADAIRRYLDMDAIYAILENAAKSPVPFRGGQL